MNHRIKGRKLGRNSAHRKALFSNMAGSLLQYEVIKTTLPKAKELRPIVEKLVTKAKKDNLSNRRLVQSIVKQKSLVNKLFSEVAPRFSERNGGYLRIMKFGFRVGDKAPMAIIGFVDKT